MTEADIRRLMAPIMLMIHHENQQGKFTAEEFAANKAEGKKLLDGAVAASMELLITTLSALQRIADAQEKTAALLEADAKATQLLDDARSHGR